jgi:hypothetical protein
LWKPSALIHKVLFLEPFQKKYSTRDTFTLTIILNIRRSLDNIQSIPALRFFWHFWSRTSKKALPFSSFCWQEIAVTTLFIGNDPTASKLAHLVNLKEIDMAAFHLHELISKRPIVPELPPAGQSAHLTHEIFTRWKIQIKPGSGDPYHWLMVTDPALFISGFQDATKN